jgi:hypothetical protein
MNMVTTFFNTQKQTALLLALATTVILVSALLVLAVAWSG